MQHKLISGDNHIDLTYCPADLWSSQAPAKWKQNAPRVEGAMTGSTGSSTTRTAACGTASARASCHTKGSFGHIDEMKEAGFLWDSYPGAQPRPTTPELRIADLDRDGLEKEIIYGCLMVNDLIDDADLRVWVNARYNDWAADFARRSDPNRVFPLAIIPNTDPIAAAAEVRRCAKMGLKGGDLAFKRMSLPLYHHAWYALWEAAAECKFRSRSIRPASRRCARPTRPRWRRNIRPSTGWYAPPCSSSTRWKCWSRCSPRAPARNIRSSTSSWAESGVTWLPYVFDRLDTEYHDRARSLGFKMKPSDYFRRQGYVTYQQDKYLEPIVPLIGEDNIIWGADYPHPDCIWPNSRETLTQNLASFSDSVQKKIVHDNVARLCRLN
jgi:predicted TIM-barrel fold metal-dependent hydrolase